MPVKLERVTLTTQGNTEVLDLTPRMRDFVGSSGLSDGLATAFVVGSTAAITTLEFEPGLVKDIAAYFERAVPAHMRYHHHDTWHDDNGHSHIRASSLGQSFSVPVENRKLLLGTWQQVVLIDFDTRPRSREVILQILGF